MDSKEKIVKIVANCFWNHTGVILEKNVFYSFSITKIDNLIDSFIETDANGYNRFWLNPFKSFLRYPAANWFTLIGTIDKNHPFRIGMMNRTVLTVSGELICYFNDIPGFYWNNKGFVELRIRQND